MPFGNTSAGEQRIQRVFSCGAAVEGSPRRKPWVSRSHDKPRRGDRKYCGAEVFCLSPLRGLRVTTVVPRLTPWAAFCRNSVAGALGLNPNGIHRLNFRKALGFNHTRNCQRGKRRIVLTSVAKLHRAKVDSQMVSVRQSPTKTASDQLIWR